jgi:CheY-like chemotaxis protein
MSKATILIVEGDAILALDLQRMLLRLDYTVAGPLASGKKALALLSDKPVDLVLMDIELAGAMNGIAAAEIIHRTAGIPVVFLTGFSQDPLLEQAKIGTLWLPYQAGS